MLAPATSIVTDAENWLARFERALDERDDALLATLFHADSHWRDVLGLSWRITTVNGAESVLGELRAHGRRARPSRFKVAPHRAPPRSVTRAGTDAIEVIFSFETTDGRGNGVLRLTPAGGSGNVLKAWTLLTALDEIRGHEERLGRSGPEDKAYARDFRGPN